MRTSIALASAIAAMVAAPPCFAGPHSGLLSARPQDRTTAPPLSTGKVIRLSRKTLAYLPKSIPPNHPKRLLVVMGGTGTHHEDIIRMLVPVADSSGTVLVAPHSRDENFDAIENFFDDLDARKATAREPWPEPRFGDDTAAIDQALKELFSATRISPNHIAILGFSHGGSYALSLGTANPQLFGAIAALSPGVLIFRAHQRGNQRVFLAHGRRDSVQPFGRTAHTFSNKLTALGYRVTFMPYDGGHETPAAILNAALKFVLNPPPVAAK